MANEFIIRKGYKSLANSEITGSLNVTVDITGSAFKGDGSALTGVTAEWDGSHTGNASITGDLSAQGFHIDGASLETYHDFQSKPIDTDSGLFTIGGHGMQNGYTRALSLWSSTDGVWNSWIGTNLRWDGTNFKRASNNGGQNWGNVSGIRFLGNSATTGASMQFVVNPPAQTSAPSGEQTVGTAVPSSWTALSIDNDKKVTTHGALTSLGDANFNGYLQAHSTFYVRSIIQVMNKAANGFLTLGNRNTSGTEVVYDLGYIGTITAAGKIQGAELEGTSLDINGNADISGNLSGVDTLTATTLSVTNYGLVSGDIPNNAANTTGNADTSTTAGSAAKLTDGGSLTSQPGQNNLIHTGQINAGTSGLFATSDNSNSVITLNRHSGNYDSQLGFSSNGNLYYRKFSNSTAFTTQTWKQLAFTDSNITGNAATVTTNANLTGHVTSVGNATSLGSFTTAELNAAISDGSINIPQTLPTDFVSAANGGTFSGTVTINKDGDALNLRSVTNGQPTNLTFSTNVPDSQIGHIKYSHSNSASYGGGDSFTIGGTETTTVILADGQLMYKDGIYSKPATGTGAGTRKDSNWDAAFTHSTSTHAPTNAEANVQSDWNATSGDALILNKPTIPSGNSIIDWTADQGSTNIHVNNVVGYINSTEPNEPFNPFAGQKFHDGVLTNALAGRHDRFVVTIDGTVEAGASLKLSNQNFEEYNQNRLFGTSAGETKVFNINVQSLASGSPSSSGITYSSGFFDINFYSSPFPASWSARVKNKDGVWNPVTSLSKIGNSKLRGVIPISLWLTDIEFTLTARTSAPFVTGNITYGISEFELFFSRMTASQGGNISSLGGYLGGTITTAGGTTSTNWNSAYGWGDHSVAGYSTATGVANNAEVNVQADWNETSNTSDAFILNKPTVSPPSQLHRQTGGNESTNIGPGWITVAKNQDSRKHGEVIVSDSDSSDHAFIRIDWMRSYADSNFSVLNVGGHANRITGVRVLSQDSDNTYGWKYLQVYVTTASVYGVRVHTVGTPRGYSSHTSMTPILENTKSGYSIHGNALTDLNNSSLAAEEGLTVGGDIAVGGTVDGVDIAALPTSFAPTNAEANVQADWNETTTTSDAFILNKPTIPTVPASYAPTDAEANVQADWNETTTTSDAFILNKPTTFAPSTHNHDDRYYTETESNAKFLAVDGSSKEWIFEISDESTITGNKWYKVATVNKGNGGLHIRGFMSNHVEGFAMQKLDLAIGGREGGTSENIEITGQVDVLHNASGATDTDKCGIRIIESDITSSAYYHYFDVYVRTTRYQMLRLHLTKSGATAFHLSAGSNAVTTEPAPVSGGTTGVEIDTSTLEEGNYVVDNSTPREIYHEGHKPTLAELGAAADTVVNQTDFVSAASGGTFGGAITVTGELEATSLDINGNADISGNLLLGSAGTENFISFAGTTGDTGGTTFIGEYLYGGTEQSELILYKGNDGHASTASPDRIRMIGANLCFDVYNVAQSYPTTMAGVAGLTTIRALTIDQTKLATFTGNISLSGTGIKSIQSGGDIALKTSTGEYALYGAANGNTNLYYNGVQHFRTGPDGVVVTGDVAVGVNKYTLTVNAPTNLTTTVVNDTINVTFTASTTTNIDNYLIFSSIAGGDYGLISVIPPADFGATMSIIDDSFNAGGTQAYRVYAVKNGVYSSPLTGSQTFTVGTIEPSNLSVVNLNTAYYIQYDAPSAKGRFVASYNIYKHEHATASSLDRNSASLVYSGINNSFMYGISGVDNNNFHQFWVEVTTA